MQIISYTDAWAEAYDAFLSSVDHSLLYYSVRYKRFLEALLECESDYKLAVDSDDRVMGVLPLMRQSGPYGVVVNSLPYYGSNGGVLARTADAASALTEQYTDLMNATDIVASTWIANPLADQPSRPDMWTCTDERIGQVTRLPTGGPGVAEELAAMFDSAARRNVKKAQRSGVQVEVDNAAFDFLQAVHVENMQAMGGKAKSSAFFGLVAETFDADRDFRIYKASVGGRPIAALLLFYFNNTVEYFTPVTRGDFRELQPMAAILYEAMVDAAQRGYRFWNWGGTWMSQTGVYRFKRKWGAQDYPYTYYVSVKRDRLEGVTPRDLEAHYPGFYVLPYSVLNSNLEDAQ